MIKLVVVWQLGVFVCVPKQFVLLGLLELIVCGYAYAKAAG
jgi:hypothetical protein